MRKVYSIAAIAILGLVFQACGQKGPLRLPDRAKPVAQMPAQPSAPATAKSDNLQEP
jgi:predicted small lipoprotein YifL